MKITQINFYPLKSCGGIALQSAIINPKGIERDRKWMLINEQNRRISQREVEMMTQIKVSQGNNGFFVSYPLADELYVPFHPESKGTTVATIWKNDKDGIADTCEVQCMDESFHRWFTAILGVSCRFVFVAEETRRPAQAHNVGLADSYHSNIFAQENIGLLNSKLSEISDVRVSTVNFRPNFVFEGAIAHVEDEWLGKEFMIGEAKFAGQALCMRCKIPTLNPDTGEENKVITASLAKYRMKKPPEAPKIGIYFGLNLSCEDVGKVIKVGDEITLL